MAQPKVSLFRRAWQSLVQRMVHDVSPENAACEFGCHVTKCDTDKWEPCENRLQSAAEQKAYRAGEKSAKSGSTPT